MLTQEQEKAIQNQIKIDAFSKRKERLYYLGIMNDYQLYMNKSIYKSLNPHQHFLFKRVVHGLNIYTKGEIEKMHWSKVKRIKKVWIKGQNVINELKQRVCYHLSQELFKKYYFDKHFHDEFEYDHNYQNNNSLKELGLNYDDLIIKFIEVGLLPKNFLTLNHNGNVRKTEETVSGVEHNVPC